MRTPPTRSSPTAPGGAPHPQPAPSGTQDASACPRQSSARLSRAARAARRPPAAAAQTHHGMHPPQALLYMVASDTHRTPLVRLPAAGKDRLHGRTIGGLLSVSLRREHDDHQLQVATVAVAMAVAVRYTTTSGGEQTAMCRRPVPVRSACGCCTAASPEICDDFLVTAERAESCWAFCAKRCRRTWSGRNARWELLGARRTSCAT